MVQKSKKKKQKRALKVQEPKFKVGDPYYKLVDPLYGELVIKYSANAWWMDSRKVEMLINAFKYRATMGQASVAAGITEQQLYYFVEVHPEFSSVMDACKHVTGLAAKKTMARLLEHDPATVRWFLEATEAGDYGKKPPVVAVQINMSERINEDREKYE